MHREAANVIELRCGRVRPTDEAYLRWVRELPCIVCGSPEGVEAHHEPPKGMGGGHSCDYDAVPLCARCHRIRHGQEPAGQMGGCRFDAVVVQLEAERARRVLLQHRFGGQNRAGRR